MVATAVMPVATVPFVSDLFWALLKPWKCCLVCLSRVQHDSTVGWWQ